MDPLRFVPVIAALACPLIMGLMMWLMHRQMGGSAPNQTSSPQAADPVERLAALRQQRAVLDSQIAEVTEFADLQTIRAAQAGRPPELLISAAEGIQPPSSRQG